MPVATEEAQRETLEIAGPVASITACGDDWLSTRNETALPRQPGRRTRAAVPPESCARFAGSGQSGGEVRRACSGLGEKEIGLDGGHRGPLAPGKFPRNSTGHFGCANPLGHRGPPGGTCPGPMLGGGAFLVQPLLGLSMVKACGDSAAELGRDARDRRHLGTAVTLGLLRNSGGPGSKLSVVLPRWAPTPGK